MIELRGIIIDSPDGTQRIRLVARSERGDNYTTLEFPSSLSLSRGQLIKFLGETYSLPPGEIRIAPHIDIKEK
uniref:Uncharacterized protein n=1 Tax=viral metagenome TaxID=1070528 RepID=A0A6M3IFE8_9ZZZZ